MANGGAPPLSQPTSRPCEGLAPGDHSRTQLTITRLQWLNAPLSLYRSILRLAVFGKFGDATRPDDHTSPRAHARSSAAASPHPDAVLTRLAAQRSNVLELHSALTTADGHTARRSKLVEHGGARSWE
jgi:hypothetical protein